MITLQEIPLKMSCDTMFNTGLLILGGLLFNGNEGFNPTVQQRIGSKRLKLVNQMLDGMQHFSYLELVKG